MGEKLKQANVSLPMWLLVSCMLVTGEPDWRIWDGLSKEVTSELSQCLQGKLPLLVERGGEV